jgi:hypothetical protein
MWRLSLCHLSWWRRVLLVWIRYHLFLNVLITSRSPVFDFIYLFYHLLFHPCEVRLVKLVSGTALLFLRSQRYPDCLLSSKSQRACFIYVTDSSPSYPMFEFISFPSFILAHVSGDIDLCIDDCLSLLIAGYLRVWFHDVYFLVIEVVCLWI